MMTALHDMTRLVNLTAELGAGPLRSAQPQYLNLMPPCNQACPAGENIQAWLAHAQAGSFQQAWLTLMQDNPLPATCGRVCYHPCESGCNRAELDSAVGIHAVERFLGDLAVEQGWQVPVAPATGKRVLVVGAGPGGLSAAYQLRRLGHAVEIQEAGPVPGGMLHFGIPAYRLPREDLMKEVRRIEAMGVSILLNRKVDDLAAAKEAGHFDAVFVAIGAQIGRRIEIPAFDSARVLTALQLLHSNENGKPPKLGRRVAVYGAGNTAMDAARTAKRLGAVETTIIFFSDRQHMEAQAFEAEEALSEGIKIKWLSSIRNMGDGEIKVEIMALDAQGQPQPTGQFETLQENSVVLALGQQADSGFLKKLPGIAFKADGTLVVTADMMTGSPGVFAGGDVVPGGHTVTIAIGNGKKAARHIDAWLKGQVRAELPASPVVRFSMLNLPIYADAEPSKQVEAAVAQRLKGFDEIMASLSQPEALHEAKRCLSCGNCFECDNCFAACPEQAIHQQGPGNGYRIDLAACTGCAVCVAQCPCHAMEMIPEPPRAATGRAKQKAVA
jgi:NADPH-dependent glutamate synthase beta subunit-like oxidoreductase